MKRLIKRSIDDQTFVKIIVERNRRIIQEVRRYRSDITALLP